MKNKFLLIVLISSLFHPAVIPGKLPDLAPLDMKDDSLKVLTWNVYMLPKIASLSKEIGNTHLEQRAEEIANYLLRSHFDVVVLQEVFDPAGYRILKNILKEKYAFISSPFNNRHIIKTHSGLVLLSRYPIYNFKTLQFSDCAASDCFSNKGAFQACFTINHRNFRIIGTHLQSDYQYLSEYKTIRQKQLKEILAVFKIEPKDNRYTNLFCGDFNISNQDSLQYPQMLHDLNANNFDNACCNYTWQDYRLNKKEQYFFDYCLVNQPQQGDVICQQVLNNIDHFFSIRPSDHFPVELVMHFPAQQLLTMKQKN
jgi:endonuclease/exonuclease/phosphatase family metal-dependent hydrolase